MKLKQENKLVQEVNQLKEQLKQEKEKQQKGLFQRGIIGKNKEAFIMTTGLFMLYVGIKGLLNQFFILGNLILTITGILFIFVAVWCVIKIIKEDK